MLTTKQVRMRKKWVELLRSGKFVQGRSMLYVPGDKEKRFKPEYCCLGVACRVLKERGKLDEFRVHEGVVLYEFLNKETRDIFGLTERQQQSLANMNDRHISFDEIADEIDRMTEQQLKRKK